MQVCDRGGNPCDDVCGGAGCSHCGGLSCDKGALQKSKNALELAKKAEEKIEALELKAGRMLEEVCHCSCFCSLYPETGLECFGYSEELCVYLAVNHANSGLRFFSVITTQPGDLDRSEVGTALTKLSSQSCQMKSFSLNSYKACRTSRSPTRNVFFLDSVGLYIAGSVKKMRAKTPHDHGMSSSFQK